MIPETFASPPLTVFTLLNGDLHPRAQEVEIASSLQIPIFQIIGLPGPEVSEAKDRVRAAIEATGFEFPRRKIVLNLSPASVRKKGTGLDLAMAVAVIIEGMKIKTEKELKIPYSRFFAWGELGLGGNVKAVGAPARALASAYEGGAECIFVARSEVALFEEVRTRLFAEYARNTHPESFFTQIPIFGVDHLSEVIRFLQHGEIPGISLASAVQPRKSDFSETSPNRSRPPHAKNLLPLPRSIERTIRLAASGSHHFLLLGPKGAGKSHALEWFLALQPEPNLETQRLRSYLGEISGKSVADAYRRVGTQARPASLLGSFAGGHLRPGELSLAHGGVLLADEFPEWSRDAREALREPLERRSLTLTRVDGAVELPSDFIFAGNGNLCPCGGIPEPPCGEEDFACRCLPVDRTRYLSHLSGPILDRLDLVGLIRRRPEPTPERDGESELRKLKSEVAQAREILLNTYGRLPGKMEAEEVEGALRQNSELMRAVAEISFRSFRDRHKTLRITYTIAALHGRESPQMHDLMEARVLRTQTETLFRPA